MHNGFPGNCLFCGKRVEKGAGHIQRKKGALKRKYGPGWAIRCHRCVGHGNTVSQEKINPPT